MSRWIGLTAALAALLVLTIALAAQKSSRWRATADAKEKMTNDTSISPNGEQPRVPVLVELFTSEGCSSCPPADDLLARLEESQPVAGAEIIALGQHVDYWNRLGWADPFSSAAFSQRQYDYAEAFDRDGVYTPQMIVDGRAEFPGGNQAKARAAIAEAARSPKVNVSLSLLPGETNGDRMTLKVAIEKLPVLNAGDEAEVWLAIAESGLSTSVPRGENAGRTLRHAGVVRQLSVIGSARSGTDFSAQPAVAMQQGWRRKHLRAVVFVQERVGRRVLGAASLRLIGE